MIKRLFTIALVLALTLTSATAVRATTTSEYNGCQGYDNDAKTGRNFEQSVKRNGSYYPGIAKIRIYVKDTDNGNRYCTVGYNKTDKSMKMKLMICTRANGSASNPLTCAPNNKNYTDEGWFKKYAGGVALTPTSGRCAAVKLKVTYKGKVYQRTIKWNQGLCN